MFDKSLKNRIEELERLLGIIERGKHMWESTFDAITEPLHIVSPDFIVERANLALAKVSNLDIRDVIGKKCHKVFAMRDEPCDGCPMRESLVESKARNRLLKEPINAHEFEANAFPYIPPDKKEISVVMYYRDVTEERRLQREVLQQEKMAAIGMLAGGVAHEINNPLSGIIAFAQLMRKDIGENENLKEDLKEIEDAAKRCKRIVQDLLDYSRFTKPKDVCYVDVNSILEKVFPFIKGEFKSYNVEMVFSPEKGIPEVQANPDRLQQVFLNLLTNACHAMPKGGTVEVKTRKDGGNISVIVKDNGVGIAEEDKVKVFDPFFTTKEPGKGTGLGLSISYRIIKELGGDLSFESTEGKGTTFFIKLPAV